MAKLICECRLLATAPIELLSGKPRPDLFQKILKKEPDQQPTEISLTDKLLKAYLRPNEVKGRKEKKATKTRKAYLRGNQNCVTQY
jgi:hypothetical protein